MKSIGIGLMVVLMNAGLWAVEAVQPLEGRHGGKAGDVQTGSFLITNILSNDMDVAVTLADLTNAGSAVPLKKGTEIVLEGPVNFLLHGGESRPVNYRVTFPTPFENTAGGAITLIIRRAGDSLSTPVVNRLLPIYLYPVQTDAPLKIELDEPNMRFNPATGMVQGPQNVVVSVIVRNIGGGAVQPRGRVEFRMGMQPMEILPLQGTDVVAPGATTIYSGMTQRTDWPSGNYEARVTFDYGDYHQEPQRLEKVFSFNVSGQVLTVQPGSATPDKVTPR